MLDYLPVTLVLSQYKKELPMKILVEDEIQEAIERCKPSKIAVAYIGPIGIPLFQMLIAWLP